MQKSTHLWEHLGHTSLATCSFVCVKYSLELKFSRFKFDDERVTKEDAKKALEEQYGGEEEVFYNFRGHIFYLVYLINTELIDFICSYLRLILD
jgi:hypothetical protein